MTDPPPGFEPAPKIVRPRSRRRKRLPVIAVCEQNVLTEAGELMTLDDLTTHLPDMPPTLLAANDSLGLLVHFDKAFSVTHPAAWQWRTSDDRRVWLSLNQAKSGRQKHMARVTVTVAYLGFKGNHFYPTYHKLIDPVTMFQDRLSKVLPGEDELLCRVLRWAVTLRDFCDKNNLEVRPTMGGISSQFLTDTRFYPNPRRKVPTFVNEVVRENKALPGNHYQLTIEPNQERTYNAYVLDQSRAHHYHAQRIRFPDANHMHAYGYSQTLSKYYRDHTSPNFMGLYCLDLQAPGHPRAFSWLSGRNILERQFVFTNELPHLADMGYTVLGVRAAWGSHHRETGLNNYATWAQEQLDLYSEPWIKPLLLSMYGSLGARRSFGETVFRLASRGESKNILTHRGMLTGKLVKRPKALEPKITNIIQLGMIHAATRSESVGFAQWITHRGQRVLHIFADAVFLEVNDDRPLPELPEPWRIKQELTHYQPLTIQAYTSDQETKNPGVRVDHRDRHMVAIRPPHMTHRVAPLQ